MSPENAAAIIEGFKKNGLCGALPYEIFGGKFHKRLWRIQSWLPVVNKMASDALWYGNERLAFTLLLKMRFASMDDAKSASRYRSQAVGHVNQDVLGPHPTLNNPRKGKDWHTVKAVRSKAKRSKFRG